MAGDWIKMRVWIRKDPRIIWMADYLAARREFMDWLTNPVQRGCESSAYEHVTRNVTQALCVTGLLEVWGTAREQGERIGNDLVVRKCDLDCLDSISDIPCFGQAMAEVGWATATENAEVLFPKFFSDKESPADRYRSNNAERQARYRDKHRNASNVTDNVTSNAKSNVTVTHREEKRREEIERARAPGKTPTLDEVRSYCEKRGNQIDPQRFLDYHEARGWKLNGRTQVTDWRAVVRLWEEREKAKPQPASTADDDDLPDVTNYRGAKA